MSDDEITRLRADLAAITAQRDRMREALNKIAERHIPDQPASDGKDEADYVRTHYAQLRWIAKRAALEGVTEKTGAGNE